MHHKLKSETQGEAARAVLGVPPGAGAEEIRAAYLRKVQEHPPERSPEIFEQIRDAYRYLNDDRRRARENLLAGDPLASFVSLLDEDASRRRFVGPEAWLRAIREGGS